MMAIHACPGGGGIRAGPTPTSIEVYYGVKTEGTPAVGEGVFLITAEIVNITVRI